MQLTINGKASGKVFKVIDVLENQLSLNLLLFLHAKGVPIASSCSGENVCRKCNVNNDVISCQYTIEQFIKKYGEQIFVSYL